MNENHLPITVISDCTDDNAKNRVLLRAMTHFAPYGGTPGFIGVKGDLDAGGNLVDVLDASAPGIIIVNAAPRGGRHGTMWQNGSPFGAFTVGQTVVVATVDGYTLSFAKRLGLVREEDVRVFDVRKAMEAVPFLKSGEAERIANTQFRSFEFAPLLAYVLYKETDDLPYEPLPGPIPDLPQKIWWVDNFGNSKTSVLPEDVGWQPGESLLIKGEKVPCHRMLSEVPESKLGIVIGSSGYNENRFLELVVKRGSAAQSLGLEVGTNIF